MLSGAKKLNKYYYKIDQKNYNNSFNKISNHLSKKYKCTNVSYKKGCTYLLVVELINGKFLMRYNSSHQKEELIKLWSSRYNLNFCKFKKKLNTVI